MGQHTRILQLTDLHLFKDQETKLIGLNPYNTLQKVLAKISVNIATKQPDLIALTGDISQDYSRESYETAAKIFDQFSCPVAATMGNHDHLSTFVKAFKDLTQPVNKEFTLNNWRILFLNSHWPENVGGQLADQEFDFLQKALAESANQHVLIFLHHQVLSVNSVWLDKINLSNAKKLLEIIDQHQNIKAVICGHVHQKTSTTRRNITYLSTPSTSWQFTVGSDNFKLDSLMPGYRCIDLYEDGTFQTEVVRIDHDDAFIPDLNTKGY